MCASGKALPSEAEVHAWALLVTQVPKGPRSFYKDGEAASVRWDANDRVSLAEPESDGLFSSIDSRRTTA